MVTGFAGVVHKHAFSQRCRHVARGRMVAGEAEVPGQLAPRGARLAAARHLALALRHAANVCDV